MWAVVDDVNVVLEKDRAELLPIMEKWNKASKSVVASPRSTESVTSRAKMALSGGQMNIKRMPMLGRDFSEYNINFVK